MHHGDTFMGYEFKTYVNGKLNHFDQCEKDFLSLLELTEMDRIFDYVGDMRYFTFIP